MRASIAYLIKVATTYDEIKQPVDTETQTEIFVKVRSITRTEWATAGRLGLNPEVCLVTPTHNYSGETTVLFEGVKYGIYRTYELGDQIELYLQKKGGVKYVPLVTSTNG